MQNREGEDYGRRQGYSTKMPDSFTPRFPNRLEAGTTNMNQFHDTEAPPPLPLPQAQALHNTRHAHVLALRTRLQVAEKA